MYFIAAIDTQLSAPAGPLSFCPSWRQVAIIQYFSQDAILQPLFSDPHLYLKSDGKTKILLRHHQQQHSIEHSPFSSMLTPGTIHP